MRQLQRRVSAYERRAARRAEAARLQRERELASERQTRREAATVSSEAWEMVRTVVDQMTARGIPFDLHILEPDCQPEYMERRGKLSFGLLKEARAESLGNFVREHMLGGWSAGSDFSYTAEATTSEHMKYTEHKTTEIFLGSDYGIYSTGTVGVLDAETWVQAENVRCNLTCNAFGTVIEPIEYARLIEDAMAGLVVKHDLQA